MLTRELSFSRVCTRANITYTVILHTKGTFSEYVYFKSPYIPFLLSWPDNDEAIKYLELAVKTGKAEMNQKNYLAQAINKDGQVEEARKLLTEVINTEPDSANLVEDLDDIKEAKQLLEDL